MSILPDGEVFASRLRAAIEIMLEADAAADGPMLITALADIEAGAGTLSILSQEKLSRTEYSVSDYDAKEALNRYNTQLLKRGVWV